MRSLAQVDRSEKIMTVVLICTAFVAGTFFGVFAIGLGQAAAAGDRFRSRRIESH
jgi:hypothetical protein